jgi:hypothetical protein
LEIKNEYNAVAHLYLAKLPYKVKTNLRMAKLIALNGQKKEAGVSFVQLVNSTQDENIKE